MWVIIGFFYVSGKWENFILDDFNYSFRRYVEITLAEFWYAIFSLHICIKRQSSLFYTRDMFQKLLMRNIDVKKPYKNKDRFISIFGCYDTSMKIYNTLQKMCNTIKNHHKFSFDNYNHILVWFKPYNCDVIIRIFLFLNRVKKKKNKSVIFIEPRYFEAVWKEFWVYIFIKI